jgi:hypothetical protein
MLTDSEIDVFENGWLIIVNLIQAKHITRNKNILIFKLLVKDRRDSFTFYIKLFSYNYWPLLHSLFSLKLYIIVVEP